MSQETSTIRYHHKIKNGYHKIGLSCDVSYAEASAGQFVTLKVKGNMDPLLRRPFSIHRIIKDKNKVSGLEILYRVVGNFTARLSEMAPKETIDLLGPLGHGFTLSAGLKKPLLVAGGIGVAPIVFLAESLGEQGIDLSGVPVFLGGKTAADILCEKDFSEHGMTVNITTEDGGYGQKGMITEPLALYLATHKPDIIYSCGPHGLLHAVADIAAAHQIRCEVSIETIMACGLGVCMGCAVKTKDYSHGYRHICKDGPVFDASVVVF